MEITVLIIAVIIVLLLIFGRQNKSEFISIKSTTAEPETDSTTYISEAESYGITDIPKEEVFRINIYDNIEKKTILNKDNINEIINCIDKLQIGEYEQFESLNNFFRICVSAYGKKTSYELYDNKYISINGDYSRKLNEAVAKELANAIRSMPDEALNIDLEQNYYDITQSDIYDLNINMTYRQMMESFGRGELEEGYYSPAFEFYLELNISDKYYNMVFIFNDQNDKIEIDGEDIIKIIKNEQINSKVKYSYSNKANRYYFYSSKANPYDLIDISSDGELYVYSCVEGCRVYDKNNNLILLDAYEKIEVYDKDHIVVCNIDDQYAMLKSNGEMIMDFKYSHIDYSEIYNTGTAILNNDKCILINSNGKKISYAEFDDLFYTEDGTLLGKVDDKYEIINIKGEILYRTDMLLSISELKSGKVITHYIINEDIACNFDNLIKEWVTYTQDYAGTENYSQNYTYKFSTDENYKNKYENLDIYICSNGKAYCIFDKEYQEFKTTPDIESKIEEWIKNNKEYIVTIPDGEIIK